MPKPILGDRRYLAIWTDANALESDALKNGWTTACDHGPLNYVDSADSDKCVVAADFAAAVSIARSKVAADFFGCPRVYLQEFGPADMPADAREWEDVKFWDIENDGSAVEQAA